MPTEPDRYLNLALINLGEAITQLGNLRQRGVAPGPETTEVQLALLRATAALKGELYVAPPIDPQHAREGQAQGQVGVAGVSLAVVRGGAPLSEHEGGVVDRRPPGGDAGEQGPEEGDGATVESGGPDGCVPEVQGEMEER